MFLIYIQTTLLIDLIPASVFLANYYYLLIFINIYRSQISALKARSSPFLWSCLLSQLMSLISVPIYSILILFIYLLNIFIKYLFCPKQSVQFSSVQSLSPVRLFAIPWTIQARILEMGSFPFSRGSSQPRSPALQAHSLPAKPQGKPKNTGVGNLSLLQRIFQIQE